jgi:phosphoribosylaminoimidazole-succinocarboxamide synthase
MPLIPEIAGREYISGLPLVARGKVRDTYTLEDASTLLPLATDRVSIFDFVLPAEVPQKGEVLTAMNVFWAKQFYRVKIAQDFIRCGKYIDDYLPEALRGNPVIQKRGIVVQKLKMIPVEGSSAAISRAAAGPRTQRPRQTICSAATACRRASRTAIACRNRFLLQRQKPKRGMMNTWMRI